MSPRLISARITLFVASALGVCAPFEARAAAPAEAVVAPARGPLFYPQGPGALRVRGGLGVLVDVLPRRVVESEIRQFPLVSVDIRLGLPKGFGIDARMRAIVISNQVDLGASYALRVGPLWLGAMSHVGYWVGVASLEGFDALGSGWVLAPGLVVGTSMNHVRFTLGTEAILTFGQTISLGPSGRSTRQRSAFAGTATTLTVETMLDSGREIFFGVGLLYTLPDYQAWIAFSDERARIIYPRLFGGYAF